MQPQNSRLHFGSTQLYDLGTSNKRCGHVRILTLDDEFRPVGPISDTTLNDQGFKTEQDIVDSLANRLTEEQKKYRPLLGADDRLRQIVAFTPVDSFENVPLNVICENGHRATQLNFEQIPHKMHQMGVPISNSTGILYYNDTLGGAAAAAHRLLSEEPFKQTFQPGSQVTYLVLGGGVGTIDIRNQGNAISIGSVPLGSVDNQVKSITAPDLVENFAKALQLPAEAVQSLKEKLMVALLRI